MHELQRILNELSKISGGYTYEGICSSQICFPLKAGGELRFILVDSDVADPPYNDGKWHVELYDGTLPPGITGPAKKTGE